QARLDALVREERLNHAARLAQEAALLEPAPCGGEDAQRDLVDVAREPEVARGPQVVDLDVEARDRLRPLRPEDLAADLIQHLDHRPGVALERGLLLAALGEALERVLAQERVEVEACLAG